MNNETKTKNECVMSQMVEDMMSVLRDTLKELGGEYSLTCNPYGFTEVWLENDVEVWWDKDGTGPKMGELTELCALYDVILATIDEIENELG